MSIRVVCPNGHIITVNDSLAGKVGRCPTCKAKVRVPRLRSDDLSEDAIMDILGPEQSVPAHHAATREQVAESVVRQSGETGSPPKKSCNKCHREISAEVHICPYCHTYIADLNDF